MILLVILLESVTNLCFPQRSLGDVALEQGSKWLRLMLQISEVYPPTLIQGISLHTREEEHSPCRATVISRPACEQPANPNCVTLQKGEPTRFRGSLR